MKTKMNLNGTTRKALVAAIAEITGEKAIYRAMPTCSCDIGEITVIKDGSITKLMTFDASLPVQYSDRLWLNLIDRVTVYEDGSLVFRFKNGAEITDML